MTELVDIKQEQSEMFFFNAQVDQVDQQTDSYQHCKGLFSSKSRMFGTLNDFHPFIGTSDFCAKKKTGFDKDMCSYESENPHS